MAKPPAFRRVLAVGCCAVALGACGDDVPADSAPPQPCAVDDDCEPPRRCAVDDVHELALEPGDEGRCTEPDAVIGGAPASWPWRPGGSALTDRLCTAQGLSSGSSAEAAARRERQQALLATAGVRAIRLDLRWSGIEPSPSAFDFSRYDPMIDAAVASGLAVVGLLAYGVPWATTATDSDDKFPPDDAGDYGAFARAVAQHYQGKVTRYELWNEPNSGWRFFKPELHGDASRYAAMMVTAADAIAEVCPDCTVYGAGLFFHEQVINGALEFTQDMLVAHPSAFERLDAFAFHPYPRYPPAVGPEQDGAGERALGGMVADLRAVLAKHGARPDLPFGATELGWPSQGAVSEQDQAAFLSRAMLLGASLGLEPLCWFNLVDGPEHGSFPPEDDFGLYHYGSEDPAAPIDPKPARDALAWLAQLGAGAMPAGPDDLGGWHDPAAGRFALAFGSGAARWVALWSSREPATLSLPSETRQLYDVTGELLASPAGGKLDTTVGGEPVFLVP